MEWTPEIHVLLERYDASVGVDKTIVNRFREFIGSSPRVFERGHLIGHLTGSAWIVDCTGETVLLTHHRGLNCWLQLGGHADGERDIWAVALREALEESGLESLEALSRDIFDLDIHRIPASGEVPSHLHYDVRFLFRYRGTESPVVSDESNDLRWIPIAELSRFSGDESLLRMARKWSEQRSRYE